MPIKGEERRAYHGVCTSTKRPYQGQNKSSFKSDKAAVDFLFTCRSCGDLKCYNKVVTEVANKI